MRQWSHATCRPMPCPARCLHCPMPTLHSPETACRCCWFDLRSECQLQARSAFYTDRARAPARLPLLRTGRGRQPTHRGPSYSRSMLTTLLIACMRYAVTNSLPFLSHYPATESRMIGGGGNRSAQCFSATKEKKQVEAHVSDMLAKLITNTYVHNRLHAPFSRRISTSNESCIVYLTFILHTEEE